MGDDQSLCKLSEVFDVEKMWAVVYLCLTQSFLQGQQLQHDITDNSIEQPMLEVTVHRERSSRQTESLKLDLKLKIKGEVNNCHMKAGPGAPGEGERQTCIRYVWTTVTQHGGDGQPPTPILAQVVF